ncbi:MAG: amino acid adenylation domain-containing protein [Candidatus Competibacteraceae bacterium]
MKVAQFIALLERQGIILWLDGEQLRYQAPEGAMTPALRAEIGEHKAEILAFLRQATQLPAAPIQPVARTGNLPLSFNQEWLWVVAQLEGKASATYHIPAALRLVGALDRAALEWSLNEIGQRHEVLRTTFPQINGRAYQQINPITFSLPLIPLEALPPEQQEAEVQRLACQAAEQPFDLAEGPLWRSLLLRLAPQSHILLLTMHHIISDEWSLGIFTRELTELYTAYCNGQPSPLPTLTLQYADFAVWQRDWLTGPVLEEQLAYWKRQLAAVPALLTLPTDYPRPAVQSYRGARHAFTLAKALTDHLKQLSQTTGATLFMTLEAALAVLLARYAGQDDILIGTPIANRQRLELAPLIGFFVNTLVLRNDLSGNPTFRQLLGKVRRMALDAYRYQELPFERLVAALQPPRSLSHNPLFQVLFSLQAKAEPIALPGLTTTAMDVGAPAAKFDLTLIMEITDEGLIGWWEYSTDLFEAATIERMTGHFQTLLEGISADPETPITQLPLLTEAERRQLLVEWNNTATEAPPTAHHCFHHLFEEQVERNPDTVAVVFVPAGQGKPQQLSYQELNGRANQLAHYLIQQSVGPDVLVGLCVDRSVEMLVGLLGILKAGGAYVPLDPAYPSERLAFMLADARISLLLTQGKLLAQLPEYSGQCLCLDSDWPVMGAESSENPKVAIEPENLAYVIYTSGSTGTPKGVLLEQRGLHNVCEAHRRVFKLGPADHVLQFSSLSFDAATSEICMALCAGATLYVGSLERLAPGEPLKQFLKEQKISVVTVTPSTLAAVPVTSLPDLHTIAVGGEACSMELVQRWSEGRPFFNLYGPTEATIWTTVMRCLTPTQTPPIGRPIDNVQTYILDSHLQPVPMGVTGELYIGGIQVARGYLNRPELTRERFIPNPFSEGRLYKTGDLCRYRPDGNIEFLGRIDHQVKIRGFRIELGEIEALLNQHPRVHEAVVLAREDIIAPGKQLVAYFVPEHGEETSRQGNGGKPSVLSSHLFILPSELRAYLFGKLPGYMIPTAFVQLEAMPQTPNGKIDRRALPAPTARAHLETDYVMPRSDVERRIVAVWQTVLQQEKVGIHDNFFDLGGNSLLAIQVHSQLQKILEQDITITDLFQYPTVDALAGYIGRQKHDAPEALHREQRGQKHSSEIAVIGMACRFPEANSVEAFWENLRQGVESIAFFSDEELLAAGVDSALLAAPNYVKAGTLLSDIDLFDAAFFGFAPREAEILDPQQRLFLECAQEALETAGYAPDNYPGPIGIYAGAATSAYLLENLYSNHELVESIGDFQLSLTNEGAFLPTRVAYKLNLKGPGVHVQTACSTSLVAVHLAVQSLLNGECQIALAGGVSISALRPTGYLYQEGMIFSPDGHCRAFDTRAQGTIGGNGLGIVVLKRLEEALADGDMIHAVIKGSAINNDGAVKVGYTAPSVTGQAQVIREAQAVAGVAPETITYIEAHGTGTVLGDPIEIEALSQAFHNSQGKDAPLVAPWCALGSVKTNIGHADNAAGVAGLIKTVLALKHGQIPPSLHFETPNPKIDFAHSPFYVNAELAEWKANGAPRRAGVSSFGIGGTNVHVIVEKAPTPTPGSVSRPWQLLLLSAKTRSALEMATANLAKHLRQHPEQNLADVAYTLQVGRQAFAYRRMLICQDTTDAVTVLETAAPRRLTTAVATHDHRPVAFLFAGGGAQYVKMGQELYETEPIFRQEIDCCVEWLQPQLGLDLRTLLYHPADVEQAVQQLQQTAVALPALFMTQYALAKLWMAWGVHPHALIGHSLGEYTAACLAGVFSLEDALALVTLRGQLFERLPAGAMLSVALPEAELQPWLGAELSIAAVNTPTLCAVSGETQAIDALESRLARQADSEEAVEYRRIHIAVAAHSERVAPILEPFRRFIETLALQPPRIPFVSNLTGGWIAASEATDPDYWVRHLRQTVRFADGLQTLLQEPEQILLEVGPGRTLASLAQRHPAYDRQIVLTSLPHPNEKQSDVAFMLETLGRLWLAGGRVDWSGFSAYERRRRLPLPTYPFERQRYWIEPAKTQDSFKKPKTLVKRPDIADWFYIPGWERCALPALPELPSARTWLLFIDECGVGEQLVKRLEQAGQAVIAVCIGSEFTKVSDGLYTLCPQRKEDYERLLQELLAQGQRPQMIVHLWRVTAMPSAVDLAATEAGLLQGFYSLLFLAQALGSITEKIHLIVVTNQLQEVTGEEELCPEKATVLGPIKVIPEEFPNISCHSIDIVVAEDLTPAIKVIDRLGAELLPLDPKQPIPPSQVIAYRGKYRWTQTFKPIRLEKAPSEHSRIRPGGVYLITGGLGGVGLVLAEYLAAFQTKLILIGRSAFPEREDWEAWLTAHAANDKISRTIRTLQALEAVGAAVLVLHADVANYAEMQAAVTQGQARFGLINGVIHAAGVPGDGVILRKTPAEAAAVLASKVNGTLVLADILQGNGLDFMVLCSSLTSLLGGFGQIDYTAANAFLDAFAHHSQVARLTTAVNWGAWQEVGILADRVANATASAEILTVQAESLKQGILSHEGRAALDRILAGGLSQVLVSTQDFQQMLEESQKRSAPELQISGPDTLHTRSDLGVPYVAPQDRVEQWVADVWQHYLGIETIGIHDHFFTDLAGDSLHATRLMNQLQKQLEVTIPLASLFENPTVAELGSYLKAHYRDALAKVLNGTWNESVENVMENAEHEEGIVL